MVGSGLDDGRQTGQELAVEAQPSGLPDGFNRLGGLVGRQGQSGL